MFEEFDQNALLQEMHRCIEESAQTTVAGLRGGKLQLDYPPNNGLTTSEVEALAAIPWTDALESGLRKIVADAASYPLFHLFCILDGVCDVPCVDKVAGSEVEQNLHDALFESYWEWRRRRPDPGWRLDVHDGE